MGACRDVSWAGGAQGFCTAGVGDDVDGWILAWRKGGCVVWLKGGHGRRLYCLLYDTPLQIIN